METLFFNGIPCHTYGSMPRPGQVAPDFKLVSADLADTSLDTFKGKKVVLNIFPSLDTPVCAASVRRFNEAAAGMPDVAVVCVSMDLPFAQKRFCTTEGIENLTACSAFRAPEFGRDYGLQIVDGPLAGLLARAVIVIDADRNIVYADLVEEITNEPRYDEALEALRNII